jgi:beta-galactosidase/beta-glucuronidase
MPPEPTLVGSSPTATDLNTDPPPRPEYPRPQLCRPDWINLNGPWDFEFDDLDVGLRDQWYIQSNEFGRQIRVPFTFEADQSGIGDRSFHERVWYRRNIQIPAEWGDQRILLHFGAVDYRATVWVNGSIVGTHEGGHTPFTCDINHALRDGKGILVVRAEDPPTDRYIPRGKQHWEERPANIFYARTTGIWQTVWLEPVPESHIVTVKITPVIDGTVKFHFKIASAERDQFVKVIIRDDTRFLASGISIVNEPVATVSVLVDGPKLWSPESPNLYEARLELHRPEGLIDAVEMYFGYRSISTQDGKILLNGSPYYLKTVLDQGYWPESNLTPPSDEAIQADIRMTKEMGFNGVRKHQKVEDPRYLYWADKLGLLVSGEMANAYLFNDDSVARMIREWMEVISRDYNHPSIVIWVPVNESWGVPNLKEAKEQAHLRTLYYLTKSLDDTRLVIDNDGWEHTEATDLFAIHDYTKTGEEFYRRFKNVALEGVPLPLYGKLYLAPGHTYNGSPIFLSEFAGIGYVRPEDRAKVPVGSWGYSGIEPSEDTAIARLRGLYEAIARIRQIAGICCTQLYDVEQEVNGLLTYDRKPKFHPDAIRRLNELLV